MIAHSLEEMLELIFSTTKRGEATGEAYMDVSRLDLSKMSPIVSDDPGAV